MYDVFPGARARVTSCYTIVATQVVGVNFQAALLTLTALLQVGEGRSEEKSSGER